MIKKNKISCSGDFDDVSYKEYCEKNQRSPMFNTKLYKPLSSYLAGSVDIDGDALRENGDVHFDDVDSGVSSSGNVDPFANPRNSIFDLVECSNDPDAVESIRSTLGISNPEQTTEQSLEQTTE